MGIILSSRSRVQATVDYVKNLRIRTLFIIIFSLILAISLVTVALILLGREDNTEQASNNEVTRYYQKQLPDLADAVKTKPDDVSARRNYAVALYVVRDLDEAKKQYEEAIRLNGKDAVLHNNLGNTYRDLKQYDKAVEQYKQAIKIDNKNQNAYVNLANVQMHMLDKADDAIATYKRAIKAMPKESQLRILLGLAYEQNDDIDQAVLTFKDILAKEPDHAAAASNLKRLGEH